MLISVQALNVIVTIAALKLPQRAMVTMTFNAWTLINMSSSRR